MSELISALNFLDLCSGGGGFHLAAEMAGIEFEKVYYSDINEYANKIYKARFPEAIAVGDLKKIRREHFPNGRWIVTAGFPCQPFSVAGSGLGIDDDRYLWHEVLRIADEFRPDFFIFENVAGIESVAFAESETRLETRPYLWNEAYDDYEEIYLRREELQLAQCCKDLENIGAKFQVFDIPALAVNAWHRRRRIWIIGTFADFDAERYFGRSESGKNSKRKIHSGRGNGQTFGESSLGDSGSDTDAYEQRTRHSTEEDDARQSESCNDDSGYDSDSNSQGTFQPKRFEQNFAGRIRNGHSSNFTNDSSEGFQESRQNELWQLQTKKKKRVHDQSELGNRNSERDIADSDSECRQKHDGGYQFSETGGEISSGRSFSRDVWSRHWLEIAAALCRDDDGLSAELDIARLRNDIAGLYPNASEKDIARAIEKVESKYRRQRIELLGNSIVPQIPAEIFRIYKELLQAK